MGVDDVADDVGVVGVEDGDEDFVGLFECVAEWVVAGEDPVWLVAATTALVDAGGV